MQETYICLYPDRITYKYIYACPGTGFSSLFPTKRNVLEPMDKENSLNIFLSLFSQKRRERGELFNIRPSLGCTLSISKYLWLQIRCKRDLARKVRGFLRPPSSRVGLNSGIAPTSYSLPLPLLSHLPPSLPCSVSCVPLTLFQFQWWVEGWGWGCWRLNRLVEFKYFSLPQPPPQELSFPVPF